MKYNLYFKFATSEEMWQAIMTRPKIKFPSRVHNKEFFIEYNYVSSVSVPKIINHFKKKAVEFKIGVVL